MFSLLTQARQIISRLTKTYLFTAFRKLEEFIYIETAEGTAIRTGTGTITIILLGKNDIESDVKLNNVIYAPSMSSNRFSLMIYDRSYETRITSEYSLRIFY